MLKFPKIPKELIYYSTISPIDEKHRLRIYIRRPVIEHLVTKTTKTYFITILSPTRIVLNPSDEPKPKELLAPDAIHLPSKATLEIKRGLIDMPRRVRDLIRFETLSISIYDSCFIVLDILDNNKDILLDKKKLKEKKYEKRKYEKWGAF